MSDTTQINEQIASLRTADKRDVYQRARETLRTQFDSQTDDVAKMSTISNLLASVFDHFFWTGFYRVDPTTPDELVVGPYNGTIGCLRIHFSRGVCGAAATQRKTIVVPDVHAFPGHIPCDNNSQSEIVVPVFRGNDLIAVFDVDSTRKAAFDEIDQVELESIMAEFFQTDVH